MFHHCESGVLQDIHELWPEYQKYVLLLPTDPVFPKVLKYADDRRGDKMKMNGIVIHIYPYHKYTSQSFNQNYWSGRWFTRKGRHHPGIKLETFRLLGRCANYYTTVASQ